MASLREAAQRPGRLQESKMRPSMDPEQAGNHPLPVPAQRRLVFSFRASHPSPVTDLNIV
jgi:hypothetical protein